MNEQPTALEIAQTFTDGDFTFCGSAGEVAEGILFEHPDLLTDKYTNIALISVKTGAYYVIGTEDHGTRLLGHVTGVLPHAKGLDVAVLDGEAFRVYTLPRDVLVDYKIESVR